MNEIRAKELSRESFHAYGNFERMIDPPMHGDRPIEFYPELARLFTGSPVASFSVCRVLKRENVVSFIEAHSRCGEGILPLDADVLIHVAPPTPNGVYPVDTIEAFRVPKGTFVALNRGVWHHAPFALGNVANALIVLPERTYAEDCLVYEIPEEKRVKIVE
jgi:ureidoglycolate hydrolase